MQNDKKQPLAESVPKCRGSIYGTRGLDKSSPSNMLWRKMLEMNFDSASAHSERIKKMREKWKK